MYSPYSKKSVISKQEQRPRRLDRVLRRMESDIRSITVITKNFVVLLKILAILVKATINIFRNIRD